MPSSPSDRNLLFGLLALQMDLVTREQLLDGMHAWMARKNDPLALVLQERGALGEADRRAVEMLVERHVARHGDARAGLASVRVDPGTRDDLSRLVDGDVQHSVAALTTPPDRAPGAIAAAISTAARVNGAARYRKLHLHARGGLGEVHVALDEELGREVALKEIQPQHADRADFRARFLREAEITGHLEHPGIVPVHGLGSDEAGRPCYAMRLIRGESLQEAITRFHRADEGRRDPSERELALRSLLTRFVAVCNAVAYAHSRGVVHRDLKPANVMLGEYGETLVVDWGLAKVLDQPDEATAVHRPVASSVSGSATELGQAVGTPAFMPPEQASGQLDRIDHRGDVFSLGATLYCLLTGRPPYQRDGVSLLAAAAECDWPPARQVNPRTPPALGAVCARAMAARPEDRYPSARALAADVERFLADEPVTAQPEPWRERARRWAKRNRTLVTSGVVLLLASVVGLGVGLGAVRAEQARTKEQRDRAVEAESLATTRLVQVQANLTRAEKAESAAKANLKQSEANFRLARKVVDECFGIANKHPLFNQPDLRPDMRALRRLLLEKALPFYKDFRAMRPTDRDVQIDEWQQHFNVAAIQARLGEPSEAIKHFQQALRVARVMAQAQPDMPAYKLSLALTLNDLGVAQEALGRVEEAHQSYTESARLGRELSRAHPGMVVYQECLNSALHNLALALRRLGRPTESAAVYSEAVRVGQRLVEDHPTVSAYQNDLARALNAQALLHKDLGQRQEEYRCLTEAARLYRRLVQAYPRVPEHRSDLASTLHNLAGLHTGLGRPRDALKVCSEALDLRRQVARAHPDVPRFQMTLARTLDSLGSLQADLGQPSEALKSYSEALRLGRRLAEDHPDVPEILYELTQNLNSLGGLYYSPLMGRPAEAHKLFAEGVDRARRLVKDHPLVPAYQDQLARSLNNLGLAQQQLRRPTAAVASFAESVELRRRLVRANSAFPQYPRYLASSLSNLGAVQREMGQREAALRCYTEASSLGRRMFQDYPEQPIYRHELASTLHDLAMLQSGLGRPDRALRGLTEAVGLLRPLARLNVPLHRQQLARALSSLGRLSAQLGAAQQGRKAWAEAVELYRQLSEAHPEVAAYRSELSGTLGDLGHLQLALGQLKEAHQSFTQAIDHGRRLVKDHPDGADYRADLAGAVNNLGHLQRAIGQNDLAIQSLTEAIALCRALVKEYPQVPRYWLDLYRPLNQRAELLFRLRRFSEAKTDLDDVLSVLAERRKLDRGDPNHFLLQAIAHMGRANMLVNLGKPRDALPDMDRALALAPPQNRAFVRFQRAYTLARAGEHDRAAAEASDLARLPGLEPSPTYDLVRTLALCARSAARAPDRPLPLRERQAEAYARQAVALLARIARAGGFSQAVNVAQLDNDSDLAFLRHRDDYRRFRATLAPK